MWDGDRYAKFLCPLCGSDGYTRVTVKKPNGHFYVTEFYHCFGCSVMFTDPVKFTQQKRVVKDVPPVVGRYGIKMAANAADKDVCAGGG
jgi:predicted RNA-binding Zn-ribbon protein involved in translation (DUF1610 family)